MFRDDLFSVLKLGWEASRQAWRLLAPGQETTFVPESVGSSGRDMDQLAYDLRRLGHEKPARMAFSIAFILNGLSAQSIQFDRDLAEKSSLIVGILAEMLLELESTSQVSADEPTEIVAQLQKRCGLVLYADHATSSRPPRPHFQRHNSPDPGNDQERSRTFAVSEQLAAASESLLNHAINDREFLYFSTVSRIHHLSTTLRDQLAPRMPQVEVHGESATGTIELPPSDNYDSSRSAPHPEIALGTANPTNSPGIHVSAAVLPEHRAERNVIQDSRVTQSVGTASPLVFIIDDSPFFRMLLTSALEADGYATGVAADLTEAEAISHEAAWTILICGTACTEQPGPRGEWLRRRIVDDGCRVIRLVHGQPEQFSQDDCHHQVRRTDLAGLRGLVQQILGPGLQRVRRIA